eukprot:2366937-Pleurochrysis_carterae.AAC.1
MQPYLSVLRVEWASVRRSHLRLHLLPDVGDLLVQRLLSGSHVHLGGSRNCACVWRERAESQRGCAGSNFRDGGIAVLAEALNFNKTLTTLDVGGAHGLACA